MGQEHHGTNTRKFDRVEVFLILNYIDMGSTPQISIAVTMFFINKSLATSQMMYIRRQPSSEMKVAEYLLKIRDLLRRTNKSQHCLSNLKRDKKALAISSMT